MRGNLLYRYCWGKLISTCKPMKVDAYLIPYSKINSKWTKYLKLQIITPLEEKTRKNLLDLPIIFLL
jgi:hypothetical protein